VQIESCLSRPVRGSRAGHPSPDIEKAARLRSIDRADAGPPTVGRFRPMSDDARARLRPHSLHQGRALWGGMVEDTEEHIVPAGGKGCAGEQPTSDGLASRPLREDSRHHVSRAVEPKPAAHEPLPVEHEEA